MVGAVVDGAPGCDVGGAVLAVVGRPGRVPDVVVGTGVAGVGGVESGCWGGDVPATCAGVEGVVCDVVGAMVDGAGRGFRRRLLVSGPVSP